MTRRWFLRGLGAMALAAQSVLPKFDKAEKLYDLSLKELGFVEDVVPNASWTSILYAACDISTYQPRAYALADLRPLTVPDS